MFMHMLCGSGGGRDSVNNWHFLVVVPQPVGFCRLKRGANCWAWFIFLHLIRHSLARRFLAKRSFYSSERSLWSCQSSRLMKTGPLATSKKIYNLLQQTFREEYGANMYVL